MSKASNLAGFVPSIEPTNNLTVGNIVGTAATFTGNVSVGGTLTYEDVTNIDSVGLITARSGIVLGPTANTIQLGTGTTISSPASDTFTVSTNGTQRINIEADGDINIDSGGVFYDATNNRLAVGTTSPATILSAAGGISSINNTNDANTPSAQFDYDGTGARWFAYKSTGSYQIFYTNPSGGNVTERARIDSSGRLLVGTSSAVTTILDSPKVQVFVGDQGVASFIRGSNNEFGPNLHLVKSRNTSPGTRTIVQSGDELGSIFFIGDDGSDLDQTAARIFCAVDGTPGANDMPGRLVFSTTADGASSPTERMRIRQDGMVGMFSADDTLQVRNSNGAGSAYAFIRGIYSATGTVTGGTTSFIVYSNGNVENTNNSYTAISDIKLKENVVNANSQWDDIKALRPVNYNFKEGQTHRQLGLIAQEVELVSPGLVTESPDRDAEGNNLGTVTKSVNYSVLYMKAVKALQEAMERIEQLETEMAEVKAQLS